MYTDTIVLVTQCGMNIDIPLYQSHNEVYT